VEQGVAIAIAIDLSTSMWAEDMATDTSRLDVAKATVSRFLEVRSDDVGLVAFGGEAMVRLPLTRDLGAVADAVDALEVGLMIDGTDVAGAIAAAAGLVKEAPHGSKAVVLVTDGAHNREGLMPAQAARAAAAFGIRLYPIAIGADQAGQEAEMETVLTQAASLSGGQYFRATDVASLDSIYADIDRLAVRSEELVAKTIATPLGLLLLLGSLVCILLTTTFRASRWGVIP
jgi:Ca-activated chloride channel family protein